MNTNNVYNIDRINQIIKELSYFFGDVNDPRVHVFIRLFIIDCKLSQRQINNCLKAKYYNHNYDINCNNDDLHNVITDFIIDTGIMHKKIQNSDPDLILLLVNNIYKKWWSLNDFSKYFYLKYLNIEYNDKINGKWRLFNEVDFTNIDVSNLNDVRIHLRCININNLKGPLFINLIPKISIDDCNDILYTNNNNKISRINHDTWKEMDVTDNVLKELYFCVYNDYFPQNILNIFPDIPKTLQLCAQNKKFDMNIIKLVTQQGGAVSPLSKIALSKIAPHTNVWKVIIIDQLEDLRKYNKQISAEDDAKITGILHKMGTLEEELENYKNYLQDLQYYIDLFRDYDKQIIDRATIKEFVDEQRALEAEKDNHENKIKEIANELHNRLNKDDESFSTDIGIL